jgi:hypothetical protein
LGGVKAAFFKTKFMKTVNSISGGKTSSYIAKHFSADINIFSLVRIEDTDNLWMKGKDEKTRQLVSDKLGKEFIGTAEMDEIIYTILDLEQFIGSEITWVSGNTFEEVIKKNYGYLPNKMTRYCTVEMKLKPIFNWLKENTELPVEMRIGFRANEVSRKIGQDEKLNKNGFLEMPYSFSKSKGGRNKWTNVEWQKPIYPLIQNNIYKDQIQSFWNDKSVVFAPINNCVGCFHQNLILLRKRFEWHPEKMEWFVSKEGYKNIVNKTEKNKHNKNIFLAGQSYQISYEEIKKIANQSALFDINESDFNECDSGYCGL